MVPGKHTCPKWIQTLCIPGILATFVLFSSCLGSTALVPFSSNEVLAIAFPADLSQQELGNIFKKHGIHTVFNENNVQVPLTDFVRLQYLSVSEFSRRVLPDDPRNTPLSTSLIASFTTVGIDGPWRIWYVPIVSSAVYKAIQAAFGEIGSEWAWDALMPPQVLHYLWIVWLSWTLWLLVARQVIDRLYHVVLIIAWLPVAFSQSLATAALMVVGQSIAAILGMNFFAFGNSQGLSRTSIRRLFSYLVPFILSILLLVSIDMTLLIPTAISIVITMLFLIYKDSVLNFLTKKRLHRYPQFRVIVEETISAKVGRLGTRILIPLGAIALILLLIPNSPDENNSYRLSFQVGVEQGSSSSDHTGMIRSHTMYQEALTLGRIGDASWMSDSYSKPYHFEILDNRIVRGEMNHGVTAGSFQSSREMDIAMQLVLEHTRGGLPTVVSADDISGIRSIQLDSQGAVFYIMAMAPFCVLGLHRASQTRRRTRTSYTNRQVA